jgi:hypothetical protein
VKPRAEGGADDRDNLVLVHSACNRSKRENPSVDVRPYLRIKVFFASRGELLKYDAVLPHFAIEPQPSKVEDKGDVIKVYFADGSEAEALVHIDTNAGGRSFRYIFVSAPRSSLLNDADVQPRSLKLGQVWAIYSDIQINPLHEPPSCRLVQAPDGYQWLALFDGQHKTVASWMSAKETVCAKVYLDLTTPEANYLVNSIQAKIKKLPLSSFELAAKLSEEWQARFEDYRRNKEADQISEQGFVQFLEPGERNRARGACEAALIQEVIEHPDLTMKKYVHRAGQVKTTNTLITETQFTNKVLKRLLHTALLEEAGETGERMRLRERKTIVQALNILAELAFEPESGAAELTDHQLERRRRMIYQSALSYISDQIRGLHEYVFAVEAGRGFLEKDATPDHEARIRDGIRRIAEHPVWTAELDLSEKMKAVRDALSKNQDFEKAFSDVGLKRGYVVGADPLPNAWYL